MEGLTAATAAKPLQRNRALKRSSRDKSFSMIFTNSGGSLARVTFGELMFKLSLVFLKAIYIVNNVGNR